MKKVCLLIWVVFLTSLLGAAQVQDKQEAKAFEPMWEEFSVEESAAFTSHKYENGSGFYYDAAVDAAVAPDTIPIR